MKLSWLSIPKRAAREPVSAYHEQQLRDLLERVREGFALLDAGRIDVFELDSLVLRYTHSARELAEFCGSGTSHLELVVRELASRRGGGGQPDWWRGDDERRFGDHTV